MWHHKLHRGGSLGAKELDDIGSDSNVGVAALPQDLTINGQTVSPTFRYEAKNATTGLWTATVGENLTGQGSGGLVGLDTPMLDDSEAANGQGTRYWQAGNNTFGDVTTEDMVFELVFKADALDNGRLFSKRDGNDAGVTIYCSTGARLDLFFEDISTNTLTVNSGSTSVQVGVWNHALVFIDRDGSAQWYFGGAAAGSPASMSSIGSITNSAALTLASKNIGSSSFIGDIAYAAMWQRDAWLDTHLQADLAQERFAHLNSSYAAGLTAWPTQANLRNSVATLEKRGASGGQKLFTVGARWPRLERRPDKYLRYGTGFNVESQHTNLLTYSEQLDNAAWTKTRSTIDSNSGDAPDGTATMDTIVEDGTASDTHFIERTFTQSAAAHTFQAVVEPIGRSWVQLELDSATDGAASAYFDLTSGTIGTQVGNDRADARYLGAGRYMVSLTDTRSTAESCSARIYASDGDNGRSYSGASIGAVRVWGAQVTATAYPVSYIKTEGATVTRLADKLGYTGLSLPSKGAIAVSLLDTPRVSGTGGWCSVSDGSSANSIQYYSSNASATMYVSAASVAQALLQSAVREAYVWHEFRALFDADDFSQLKDGVVTGPTDASGTPPSGLNQVDVAGLVGGSSPPDALVRVRLFSKPTLKDITDFGDIMSYAFGYIATPAAVAQSTSYANVGGTFSSVLLSDFTLSAAGVLTYTGATTKRFALTAACSGSISTGSPLVTTAIEKNGTPVTGSESQRDVGSSSIGAWATTAIVELANGDTINIATKVDTGTPNLTMEAMSLTAEEVS